MPGIVASRERIAAWLTIAQAGDEFVYASRMIRLPARSPGAEVVRGLIRTGMVFAYQRRIPGRSESNYCIKRSSKPLTPPPPVRPRLSAAVESVADDEVDTVNAVMAQLSRAARFGLPCPTDAQLARRAGIAADRIPAILKMMISAAMIRVHAAPAPTLRFVTIVDTNERTGVAV
ncbi:hypothetical protein BRX36_10610 [Sphingomonas sp. S-NIH.Pt1_0416]|nr:hypothetical protein BRX36_10610 [Sphingomonas sp. S-NIH.Pt1_0416]